MLSRTDGCNDFCESGNLPFVLRFTRRLRSLLAAALPTRCTSWEFSRRIKAIWTTRAGYNESLGIKKKLGDQSGIARSLHQLGMLAAKQGDRAEALRLFRQSLGIFEGLNSPDADVARRSIARVKAALKAKDAS